eukprot:3019137-Amphidinium_carterae.4
MGAFAQPGGEAQLRRGVRLATCVQELLLFLAWQLRQVERLLTCCIAGVTLGGPARLECRLLGHAELDVCVWSGRSGARLVVGGLATRVPAVRTGVGSRSHVGARASRTLPLRLVAQRAAGHECRLRALSWRHRHSSCSGAEFKQARSAISLVHCPRHQHGCALIAALGSVDAQSCVQKQKVFQPKAQVSRCYL